MTTATPKELKLHAALGGIIGLVARLDRQSKIDQRTDLDATWATLYQIKEDARRALIALRKRDAPKTSAERVAHAVEHLKAARELLKAAGARRTLERVRLALTSAGGAERHAKHEPYRIERKRLKVQRVPELVRHTSCRFCELDIEGYRPFKRGDWRDRGNNTTCPHGPNKGKKHAPYIAKAGS